MTKEELRGLAQSLGFFSLGVCDAQPAPHHDFYRRWLDKGHHGTMDYLRRHVPLKGDPRELLPSCQSVMVAAMSYAQPSSPAGIARYALGRDYHRVLRSRLRKIAQRLEGQSRICVDSAPLMERDFAQLAGIGWFGKNTCLIDSRRGSWFLLGTILSSQPFPPDAPAVGGCGTCRDCIDACPTGAIVLEDGRWQVDSRRCISYLTIEHRGPMETGTAGWVFGCDVCQEVCPFNEPRPTQPDRAGPPADSELAADRSWPDLKEISFEEWDSLTRGSAVRRTGYDGLKRNASQAEPPKRAQLQ